MRDYISVFQRAIADFGRDKCTSFAAAISYYALFSLFPLVIFIISFLGFFIHSESQREAITDSMFKALGQGVEKNALHEQVNAFAGGRGAVGLIGLAVALWSASSVFGAVRTGLNVAWNVTRERPLVRTKILDLAMVIGVGLLMLLSVVSTGVLTAVQAFSDKLFGSEISAATHVLFAVLFLAVPISISFVAFVITYRIVPYTKVLMRDVWLGAIVAALLFQAAQVGFGIYVTNVAHYSRVYGSLAAVIAFLFFVYISANILLFGGEVSKEYAAQRAGTYQEAQPAETDAPENLGDRVTGAIKGLFVDDQSDADAPPANVPRDGSESGPG